MPLPRTSPDVRIPPDQLTKVVEEAVPDWAFRTTEVSWTWTRPSGVWHLHLNHNDPGIAGSHGPYMKVRLDSSPCLLQVTVRPTRREVDAALRWMVLVGAIDRHPDDPRAA